MKRWMLLAAIAACGKSGDDKPKPPVQPTAADLKAAVDAIKGDEEDLAVIEDELSPTIGRSSAFTNTTEDEGGVKLVFDTVVWAVAGADSCDALEVLHVHLPPDRPKNPAEPDEPDPTMSEFERTMVSLFEHEEAQENAQRQAAARQTVGQYRHLERGMPWFDECVDWAARKPTGLGDPDRYHKAEAFQRLVVASNPRRVDAARALFDGVIDRALLETGGDVTLEQWLADRFGPPRTAGADMGWGAADDHHCIALLFDPEAGALSVLTSDAGGPNWVRCTALVGSTGSAATQP